MVINMEQAEMKKVTELLEELVLACKDSSQTATLFHDNLQELLPSLQGASSHTLPKVSIPLNRLHSCIESFCTCTSNWHIGGIYFRGRNVIA